MTQVAEVFLTAHELAARTRVSRTTISKWVKKGMPHMQAGAVLRFDLDKVLGWLQAQPPKAG